MLDIFSEMSIDLIIPHLYVGNIYAARNKNLLQSLHITHIVNAAEEIPNYFPGDFDYLELKLRDHSYGESLYQAVTRAYPYITNALKSGGTVLVHCAAGMSRSVSAVIFYLMRTYFIPYEQALALCKSRRPISQPNRGYERQLREASNAIMSFVDRRREQRSQLLHRTPTSRSHPYKVPGSTKE